MVVWCAHITIGHNIVEFCVGESDPKLVPLSVYSFWCLLHKMKIKDSRNVLDR
jgi:hypothetical protein